MYQVLSHSGDQEEEQRERIKHDRVDRGNHCWQQQLREDLEGAGSELGAQGREEGGKDNISLLARPPPSFSPSSSSSPPSSTSTQRTHVMHQTAPQVRIPAALAPRRRRWQPKQSLPRGEARRGVSYVVAVAAASDIGGNEGTSSEWDGRTDGRTDVACSRRSADKKRRAERGRGLANGGTVVGGETERGKEGRRIMTPDHRHQKRCY